MIDELIPFVLAEYKSIGNELGINCISEKTIIDFFPSPQMRLAFLKRLEDDSSFLTIPRDENKWNAQFHYDFGFGIIEPCLLIDLHSLLSSFRKRLIADGNLVEDRFFLTELNTEKEGIVYKNIFAKHIIFCEGIEGFTNPYFMDLPFAPNKGEALIVEIPALPNGYIFKKGLSIVPWHEGLFWVGSSYEWNFENDNPTKVFRNKAESALTEWLKSPIKIVDHLAAIRPAVLERRPFVGLHPIFHNIGILNGMGTKACSLAPYFAKQLASHLSAKTVIMPEVDVRRFRSLLTRSSNRFNG